MLGCKPCSQVNGPSSGDYGVHYRSSRGTSPTRPLSPKRARHSDRSPGLDQHVQRFDVEDPNADFVLRTGKEEKRCNPRWERREQDAKRGIKRQGGDPANTERSHVPPRRTVTRNVGFQDPRRIWTQAGSGRFVRMPSHASAEAARSCEYDDPIRAGHSRATDRNGPAVCRCFAGGVHHACGILRTHQRVLGPHQRQVAHAIPLLLSRQPVPFVS